MTAIPERLFLFLASITHDGYPWSVAVWYVMDGDDVIIFSDQNSRHVENIARQPRVSILFPGDDTGHGQVIFKAVASLDRADAAQQPGFVDKYRDAIELFGTAIENYKRDFPVRIRLKIMN